MYNVHMRLYTYTFNMRKCVYTHMYVCMYACIHVWIYLLQIGAELLHRSRAVELLVGVCGEDELIVAEEVGATNIAIRRAGIHMWPEGIVEATEVRQRRQIMGQGLDLMLDDLALRTTAFLPAAIKGLG